jgi:hypothetical protein
VLYLGANSPLPNTPQPALRVSHRVMMLPVNAKRLHARVAAGGQGARGPLRPDRDLPNRRPVRAGSTTGFSRGAATGLGGEDRLPTMSALRTLFSYELLVLGLQ